VSRVGDHPRHLALFALVAGLLAWPAGAAAVATLAVAAGGAVFVATRGATGLATLALVAVAAGAALGAARAEALDGDRLRALEDRVVEAGAVLLEPVRERSGGRAAVRARLASGPAAGEQAVLRLAVAPAPPPELGEIVALRGRVAPLGPYEQYQRLRGAAAAIEVFALEATGRRRGGLAGAIDRVRERAEAGLQRGLRPPEAALVLGMVLGQDERLDEGTREEFRRSGLAHLLAVSGQNVMLLATLVLAIGMAANAPLRTRLAAALVVILLYVPLAGAGPSIQRAGVMGAAGLLAALAGTPASRWYAVGLAAAVTLALNPLASQDAGWQLSFAAVIGLLALAPRLTSALARRRVPRPVAEAAAITTAATLATAPLLVIHFKELSLVSLPANLAAAVAVAPIMWLGMLAGAVAQLAPALATPLNALNEPLLAFLQAVASGAAALPHASVEIAAPSFAVVAAAGAAAVAAWRWRRGALLAGAAVAVLAVTAWLRSGPPAPDPREVVVSFLDVGQGDATLIQHRGASVLFDTGPPEGPVVKRLRQAGVQRLDALVITHAQLDHEGAAPQILDEIPTRLILNGGAGWPSAVQRRLANDPRAREVAAGQSLTLPGMRVRFLWPPPRGPGFVPEGDANTRAVVAHVQAGDFDLLLPADAESDVTQALDLPRVEALKVAHHGSEDPGLPGLLERIAPQIAAIEVGEGNRYGHPRAPTLAALRAHVGQVFRTDRDGTIRLRVTPQGIRVEHD
jgi:competence protein ComEC